MSQLGLYRVNAYDLDRDGRTRLDEIGAADAANPRAAVRAVVARYRDADALDEIATDSLPLSGATLVEPFDRLATYHLDWYADETDIYVWPADEEYTDVVDYTTSRK